MGRVYASPPLVEALCEFQFEPGQQWDLTIPGLVYDHVRHRYPKRRSQKGLALEVQTTELGFAQQVRTETQRMHFLTADETELIQVGPDLLIVNHLGKEYHWEAFKPTILDNLRKYCAVANPKGFRRMGLRYLNRIILPPGDEAALETYFNAYPKLPETLPQHIQSLLVQVDIPMESYGGHLRFAFGTLPSEEPKSFTFMLDLDFYTPSKLLPAVDSTEKWLENAHSRIELAFESFVTEKTHKEIFRENV